MDFAYLLNGGAPIARKYVIGASVANAGIPLLAPSSSGGTGLANGTTTSAADTVGVAIDTGTYTTTQSLVADIERTVTVIINPDAVFKAKMSGGATENTALQIFTVVTAASDGLAPVMDDSVASPEMDEGVVWGYSGNNVGLKRKITTTSTTTMTVTVPFKSVPVGDQFLIAPYWYFALSPNVQLTTNLYQADASIAVGTGAEFQIVDMSLRDSGSNGRTNSYVYLKADDHALAGRP